MAKKIAEVLGDPTFFNKVEKKNAKNDKSNKNVVAKAGRLSLFPQDQIGKLDRLVQNNKDLTDAQKHEAGYVAESLQVSLNNQNTGIGDVKGLRAIFAGFERQITTIISVIDPKVKGSKKVSDPYYQSIKALKADFESYKKATNVSDALIYFSRLQHSIISVLNVDPMIESEPGITDINADIELIKFNKQAEANGDTRGDNGIEPDVTLIRPVTYFLDRKSVV